MIATSETTNRWLDTLGYDNSMGVVHRAGSEIHADHPYAREIELMLNHDGDIGSSAVYEVDKVPAVCFIETTAKHKVTSVFVDEVRRKIWNQNLVSVLVVVTGETATAYPVPRQVNESIELRLDTVTSSGPFSATEIASGNIYMRLPSWFERKNRVDRVLLDNLSAAVLHLKEEALSEEQAQLVLGKCIFVSYLEDREIVADRYRERHQLGRLADLLKVGDGNELDRLFRQLKSDFNGDLLEIEGGANIDWRTLSVGAFELLDGFLKRTDMYSGQKSLWPYDFKHIPVELISGIYETFLGGKQLAEGAVYTPRHLASLAVDEVFRGVNEPWKEMVLDGACGSGILLTTSYRRMLGAARAAKNSPLSYFDRQKILLDGIRGGDISSAACKVTAFSLYLALLEDLAPSDIALLREDHRVKLPKLLGSVISAEDQGDFFSEANTVAKPGSASIVISNSPWYEPKDNGEARPYELWWKDRYGEVLPRRQIALAFARRATDALRPGGRLCLIMPVVILGGNDAGAYLKSWFKELQPERIYNLADMRFLLFDGAIHPTAVVTGVRRSFETTGCIPPKEMFDYLVPKADVSLAFGRLTVHSSDRKRLSVHAACQDAEVLRTHYWGNELDQSLIARLRLNGTILNHSQGEDARFVICKGFHLTDRSKDPISAVPLRRYRFLSTAIGNSRYPKDRYFIADHDLIDFPAEVDEVADYGSKDGQAFDGIRVVFTDGADSDTLEMRACYVQQPMCFTQTVGAIVDRQNDTKLMKFLTVYLRSKLARYLLFYTTFSLSMERPHVKLREIANLPFLLPNKHPDAQKAHDIVEEVIALLKPFRQVKDVTNNVLWSDVRVRLDELVFNYFGLSATERKVVNETCDYFIPSRQPTSFTALHQPLADKPTAEDANAYVRILRLELESWRERLQGEGHFHVSMIKTERPTVFMPAVVRLSITDHGGTSVDKQPPKAIHDMLMALRGDDIYPRVGDDVLSVASDFLVHYQGDLYLVKPFIKRLWLASSAAHDAYRVVQAVRGTGALA